MTLSRREFSLALTATAMAAALPLPALATGPDADFVYIGMHGNQITLARFDRSNRKKLRRVAHDGRRPILHQSRHRLRNRGPGSRPPRQRRRRKRSPP